MINYYDSEIAQKTIHILLLVLCLKLSVIKLNTYIYTIIIIQATLIIYLYRFMTEHSI